jgi:serine/threonine protein kinase
MISGYIRKFQLLKPLPDQMTSKLFSLYDQIKSTYEVNSNDLVACHNDLKPENILFDGESVWLVDWEAAFLNDRYADLAMAANFIIRDDNDESDYLKAYFGEEANNYQQARFFLMRQIVHFSYFVVFTLMGGTPGKPIDPNMAKPGFSEFHDMIWAGKVSLADMDARIQYALVHMDQLNYNLQLDRFDHSLAIISNHPPL